MRDVSAAITGRVCLALTVGGLACLGPAHAQSGAGYSGNCGRPEVPSFLGPGRWNGTFEIRHDASLQRGGVNLPQVIELRGKIGVTVGESGVFEDASGELASRFGGSGSGAPGSTLEANDEATAPLSYDSKNSSSPSLLVFNGMGVLELAPCTSVEAQPGTVHQESSGYGGKNFRLFLRFGSFSCNLAIGEASSPLIDASLATMEGGGYVVTRGKSSFRLQNETEVSKEVAALRKELGKVTPPSRGSTGSAKAREEEGKRLANWDRVRDGPPELIPCLTAVWMEHVEKLVAVYVQEDVNALDAWNRDGKYSGSTAPLDDLTRQATGTARLICQVGRESCSADLLAALMRAAEGAHVRLLPG